MSIALLIERAVDGHVADAKPEIDYTGYNPGDYVYASWGYDQTNIDWFRITKRSGQWITIVPVGDIKTHGSVSMTGTSVPDVTDAGGKPMRKKLVMRDGQPWGCNFRSSYGWISKWNGKPKGYTEYA